MALFDWLSQKKDAAGQPQGSHPADGASPSEIDPTYPAEISQRRRQDDSPQALNRRSERLARRELLYAVIRESMVRAGVLSASYKFKVLSLDQRGRQYVVMMDLAREFGGDPERMSETEAQIAQTAKARHDILVTSVYWRFTDQVALGLTPTLPQRRQVPEGTSVPRPVSNAVPMSEVKTPPAMTMPEPPSQALRDALAQDFENTQMEDLHGPDGPPSELGATQPGDLR